MINLALVEKLPHIHHDEILEQAARDRLARQVQRTAQSRTADHNGLQLTTHTLFERARPANDC
jgi:hypothetical protein